MGDLYHDSFIFVDIETTGLDENDGHILELGLARYDKNLSLIDMYQSLVLDLDTLKHIELKWDQADTAYRMHDKSGLLADLDALGKPGLETHPDEIARQAIEWLNAQGIDKSTPIPMAGSSVDFDKRWLFKHMPTLFERFSYRTIDVSGFREYAGVVAEDLIAKVDKGCVTRRNEHRVIPDIMDSVELMLSLRKNGVIIQ